MNYEGFFDEHYGEPTTGDLVYDEVKQILLKTIKKEYVDEMERLRAENEELRPYRDAKKTFERKLREKESECQRRVEYAEKAARDMLVEELFGENKLTAWRAEYEYVELPKCGRCDAKRKIHFTSPMGKEMTEDCACAKKTTHWKPVQTYLVRFCLKHNAKAGNQNRTDWHVERPLYRYYAPRDTRNNEKETEFVWDYEGEIGSYRYADNPETPFPEMNSYRDTFLSLERCQAFCDYLNKKRRRKGE